MSGLNVGSSKGHIAAIMLYIPLVLVVILCKLVFWAKVLYNQRHTLSHVPGPKLASWTRLWIVKTLASGNSAQIFSDINKQYGPLARIGPNHLLTNDPSLTKRILSARSGYNRAPWFDSIRINPLVANIISERHPAKHGRLRYQWAASFAPKNINAMESIIDQRISDWISRIRSSSQTSKSFDIGRRIQYLTVDMITEVCLGRPLGCVAEDADKNRILETVEKGNFICQHFSVLQELNTLFYYLVKVPFLKRILVPNASDSTGVGSIMGLVRRALHDYDTGELKQSNHMLGLFLDKGFPRDQIDAELVIALVAGSDTTSTSIQSTLLAIISSPAVYIKLKSEIHQAIRRGVSYPIKSSEAIELRYLQACILEGLRKFPPISQLREREVPPEGDIIDGHRIPGGTYIGLNSWGTQLNEVYGDDPEVFRPERWLIDDKSRLAAMLETHGLIFGYGSTKCLGVGMAKMEINKVIFELLRHFDISVANPHKPWSSVCYGIFFQKDFNVVLQPALENAVPTMAGSQLCSPHLAN